MDTAQLRIIASEAFDNPLCKEQIDNALEALNLTQEQAIQAFVDYDSGVMSFTNDLYASLPLRAAMYVKLFMPTSWHSARQNSFLRIIRELKPASIADMGFGVPGYYLNEFTGPVTLVDKFESALTFAKSILKGKDNITYLQLDMDTHDYPKGSDLYLFQDSIEHVKYPGEYLDILVKGLPASKFVFSLPVGPIVPAHTISWDTVDDVKRWLTGRGLRVENEEVIYPNPKGDLWAEAIPDTLYNVVVVCRKS